MAKSKKVVYKKSALKSLSKEKVLPHISRSIPAIPKIYLIVILSFLGFLTLVLLISSIALSHSYFLQKQERSSVLKRLVKAQQIIKSHPEQPEAYYTAALYAVRIKDYETARAYLNQALFLNPDMSDVEILLQQLEGK